MVQLAVGGQSSTQHSCCVSCHKQNISGSHALLQLTPKGEGLSSKMCPEHLASGMILPTLCSCFTSLREKELPVAGGYVRINRDGSIHAYPNWSLPDLLKKGNV